MTRSRFALSLSILTLTMALLGCNALRQTFPMSLVTPPKEKPIFLWFDATANITRLNSEESLTRILDHAVAAGITGIVVDVKPISGHVLYDSRFADRLEVWPERGNPDNLIHIDTSFDVLSEACRLGHERGLTVYASMNVFAEGHKQIPLEGRERGRVYYDHADWAAWDYIQLEGDEEPQLHPTTDHATSYTAFVSPHHPEVRAHALNIIREVVEHAPIDGIVLDRVRYDGLQSDFSMWARHDFEQYIGRQIEDWPGEVCHRTASGEYEHGPLWDQWLLFRAMTIHGFILEAREHVKTANRHCSFNTYVGAWYPLYSGVGVNWASPNFDPPWEDFPEGWQSAGYADLLDNLFVGDYFFAVTPDEVGGRADGRTDPWLSVEGSAQLAEEVVDGECPVIGSLYVEQYLFESPTGEFDRDQFARAMRAAYDNSDGLMIFDLVHIEDHNLWDILEEFGQEVGTAPTAAPSATSE